MHARLPRSIQLIFATALALVFLVVGLPSDAASQPQELKMPFPAGSVHINFDETFTGSEPHPTSLAIAFDMQTNPRNPSSDVLAVGDGEVLLRCTDKNGASILSLRVDGYASEFVYVHIDEATLPFWMSDTTWVRVQQGDVLGRIFGDPIDGRPGDPCLQFSTGPHLHIDLPELGLVLDGVRFDEAAPNDGDYVTSTNQLVGPTSAICDGLEATIIGTSGHDRLVGTPGPDVIAGLQGHDEIIGLGGDDIICGGQGNDLIRGGEGFDVIFGAQGNDLIFGADGSSAELRNDVVGGRYFGGADNDRIFGTNRWDRMQGGLGNDSLIGFEGRDWLRAGPGADRVDGGSSIDDVQAGDGNDFVVVGAGDVIRGGAGAQDRCDVSRGAAEMLISCEILE